MTVLTLVLLATIPFAALAWTAGLLAERATAAAAVRARLWTLLFFAAPLAALAAPVLAALLASEAAPQVPVTDWKPSPAAHAVAVAAAPDVIDWDGLAERAPGVLLAIAIAGAAVRLADLAMRHGRLMVVVARARTLDREDLTAAVAALAARERVRMPRLALSDAVSTPMLARHFRPVILLPTAMANLPAANLLAVCAHELAHLRRADNPRGLVEQILLALLWFNPAQAAIHRRLLAAREELCDRAALADASPQVRRDYAELLVRVLRTSAGPSPLTALTGAGRSPQIMRLKAILNPDGRASPRAVAVTLGVALAALASLGAGSAALALKLELGVSRHTVSRVLINGSGVKIVADRAQVLPGDGTRWEGSPVLKYLGGAPGDGSVRVLLNGKTPPTGFRADRVDPASLKWIEGFSENDGLRFTVNFVTISGHRKYGSADAADLKRFCASPEAGEAAFCAGVLIAAADQPGVCAPHNGDIVGVIDRGREAIAKLDAPVGGQAKTLAAEAMRKAWPC
ncbi:MAG: M56 family metallopeptidase [Caulobacter sp.]|nr:M56 family metallopeptidase [Caulobacter sp.]